MEPGPSGVLDSMIAADTGTSSQLFDFLGPILSTGIVGVILLMILFRIKIMPTYVYDDAKKEWERERADLVADNNDLKAGLKDAQAVYTKEVIPTLTRVLDAERELLDLRRAQQLSRGGTGDGGR